MVRFRNKEEILEDKLFKEFEGKSKCSYLARNCEGAYCSRGLQEGEKPSFSRHVVCDVMSLQLWCLDPERYQKCIYFQGESFPV